MLELPELRTNNSKVFLLEDGQLRMDSCQVPVHYLRDGHWYDIEPEWKRDGDRIILHGTGYESHVPDGMVGSADMHLLDKQGTPEIEGTRLFWHDGDVSYVLVASAWRTQLQTILWGPDTSTEWLFWFEEPEDVQLGGRDNLNGQVRAGREQHYALEVSGEMQGNVVRKEWSGRVKSFDALRRQSWTDDVLYPVRVM